jgi:hypothetical protein
MSILNALFHTALRNPANKRKAAMHCRRPRRHVLRLERLEGRELLSVAPTISAIGKQFDKENTPLAVAFTVADPVDPASALSITATSSNTTIIPNSGLSILGSDASRTLVIVPVSNQVGEADITLQVQDSVGGITIKVIPVLVTAPQTLPFVDTFSRPDGVFLGVGWQEDVGGFSVKSNQGATSTALGVATVDGVFAADVAVTASVNVAAGQTAGLVARYSGPKDQNYYLGRLTNNGSSVSVQLVRNAGGVSTQLFSHAISSAASGTLRFEAAGPSLKLFLNNTLVGFADDSVLTAPGSTGVRLTGGGSFDDFTANALTLTNGSLPFADNFNAATNQQLSGSWLNQLGNFQVSGGVATGHGALNVATVNVSRSANMLVQADVTITAGQSAGLVARYSGPKDRNLYLGRLVNTGTGFKAELFRNFNGVLTKLYSQAVTSTGSGTLRFEAIGPSLKLFLNNHLIAFADDSRLKTGTVGIDASSGATLDSFSAGIVKVGQATLPFADDFTVASAGGQLNAFWLDQAGNFDGVGLATGHGTLNVATVNGISAANVTLQADVNVTGALGQFAGVVSRYSGSGDRNMYFAGLVNTSSGFKVQIRRNINGTWTTLASQTVSAGSGNLRLVESGMSLTVFFNNVPVLSITDSAITSAGLLGIRASMGATIDNFLANSP